MNTPVSNQLPDATGTDLIASTIELFSVVSELTDLVRGLEQRVRGYGAPCGGDVLPAPRDGLINESVDNIQLAVRQLHNLRCDLKGLADILK